MTRTIDIEIAIMRHFDFRQKIIVPNITSMMGVLGFETDMLVLTKLGYATGLEIKVSKSDLKADFNKRHMKALLDPFNEKRALERYYKKFKYFYYAIPEELLPDALELIPEYFGILCYVSKKHRFMREARKAKTLFNYKWSDEEIVNVMRLGTMRIFSLKKQIQRNEQRDLQRV